MTTPPSTAAPTPTAPMPMGPSRDGVLGGDAERLRLSTPGVKSQRVLRGCARGEIVTFVVLRDGGDVTAVARLHGVAPRVPFLAQKLHRAGSVARALGVRERPRQAEPRGVVRGVMLRRFRLKLRHCVIRGSWREADESVEGGVSEISRRRGFGCRTSAPCV